MGVEDDGGYPCWLRNRLAMAQTGSNDHSSSQEWFWPGQFAGFNKERLQLGHHQVAGGQMLVVQFASGPVSPGPAGAVRRVAIVRRMVQRLHVVHFCKQTDHMTYCFPNTIDYRRLFIYYIDINSNKCMQCVTI